MLQASLPCQGISGTSFAQDSVGSHSRSFGLRTGLASKASASFSFFFFGGLNSELHACKAGTLPLKPLLQYIFALVILEMGCLYKLFAGAGLEPMILPISVSQVARIIGMSHCCLAYNFFWE
jgi:hypothetical protein